MFFLLLFRTLLATSQIFPASPRSSGEQRRHFGTLESLPKMAYGGGGGGCIGAHGRGDDFQSAEVVECTHLAGLDYRDGVWVVAASCLV
jgi:hypothetical protein